MAHPQWPMPTHKPHFDIAGKYTEGCSICPAKDKGCGGFSLLIGYVLIRRFIMSITHLPPCVPAKRPSATDRSPSNYHLLTIVILTTIYGFFACKNGASLDGSENTTATGRAPLTTTKSPLKEVSWLDTHVATSLSEEDSRILHEIESKTALNMKFFAIPETVYAQEETSQLYSYVETQLLHAKDVVSPKQAEMVLKLLESGVAQGSMVKKEMGSQGSLKNSMVVAILKEHEGNVHFMMAGVSLEPRLGWRLITKQQRNTWNDAVSRMLDARLRQEMGMLMR
ncbi:hypothetical protein GOP47_0015391 [Adiantum capillus-veneris]|uniref:Uncharacterized protein n=1 Tax=Adiantum capillus-veneris TaxID=13818 RepID=A0A9D4UJN7_ADICA|nr:hypothetical protein GOP47_0015391 [Adiantum capillus-veneris]